MKTFVVVAGELNFGRAARLLTIAQPAVSQQIAQLEKDLGVVLFDRTSRAVKLTTAGAAFLGPCQAALDSADAAARAAQNAGSGEVGLVRIGFAGAFANEGVSRLAREVRRRYPRLELFLAGSSNSIGVLNQLVSDQADIGIMSAGYEHPKLSQRLVAASRLGALLPVDHPLAGKVDLQLSDLAEQPFILTASASGLTLRDVTLDACKDAGFTPTITQEAVDSLTVFTLVAAGMGVTLVPQLVSPVWPKGAVLVPLSGVDRRLRTVLAWRADSPFPALRRVLGVADTIFPAFSEHS